MWQSTTLTIVSKLNIKSKCAVWLRSLQFLAVITWHLYLTPQSNAIFFFYLNHLVTVYIYLYIRLLLFQGCFGQGQFLCPVTLIMAFMKFLDVQYETDLMHHTFKWFTTPRSIFGLHRKDFETKNIQMFTQTYAILYKYSCKVIQVSVCKIYTNVSRRQTESLGCAFCLSPNCQTGLWRCGL